MEVTARIRNQLKSHVGEETESSLLTAGNIKLNDETHEVYYQDQLLSLTQKEYEG